MDQREFLKFKNKDLNFKIDIRIFSTDPQLKLVFLALKQTHE